MRELLASFAIGALLSTGAFAEQVKNREERQQERINEGVESGELTKKEAVKLEAAEAKLHQEIKENRQDGPGLTPKERAKIQKKQNKMSKKIYKQKHDKQKRNKAN